MKEIPVLFSTPMVQAILEGRKTMTRRIAAVPVGDHHGTDIMDWGLSKHPYQENGRWLYRVQSDVDDHDTFELKPKYGKPGDILWVRESFRKYCKVDEFGYTRYDQEVIEFAADNPPMINECDGDGCTMFKKDGTEKFIPWRPSIHMPKSIARIWLQVTDVSVERLQDISQEDARAEGVFPPMPHRCGGWKNELHNFKDCFRCAFKVLWNQINGPSGNTWDANPWVWVIKYKVLSTTGKPK